MNLALMYGSLISGTDDRIRRELDQLVATIATHSVVQHKDDGTHGLVTADRLTTPLGLIGALVLGVLRTPTVTAPIHNFDLPPDVSVVRLTMTGVQPVTGIQHGTPGRLLILWSETPWTLAHQHVGSAMTHRIVCGTGADTACKTAILLYDAGRWRELVSKA